MGKAAATVLSLLGTGVQIYSAKKQGDAAVEQANRNAATDKANAKQTLQEQREKSLQARRQGKKRAAQVRAITAAGGFLQEGTPLLLQTEELKTAELNALEEQRIGLTESNRLEESANLSLLRGQVAKSKSRTSQIGSLISGVSSVFNINRKK